VELVQKGNQELKGKRDAFASFSEVLGREIGGRWPEFKGEVERVQRGFGVRG